jgi:pimeloyl-ACP methyl ester carboxylesterase
MPFPDGCDVHTAATDAVRPFFAAGTHLIGHSFGATIALRLALESPYKVASLTLIEPVFFAAAKGRPSHAPHRASEEAFFEVYHQGDMLAAARVFNRLWGGGVPWDSFRSDMQQAMAKGMPFVVGTEPSLWQDCHALLRPGGLETLDMPVTLVRGSKTVPIITDVHAGLSARIPQAQEIVVPKAAHMLVLTHPDAVAQAILSTVEAAPLERANQPVHVQRP